MNKTTTGVVVGSLLLVTTHLFAAGDPSVGEKLYNNSKCMKCHSSSIFKKEDRKVKNLKELESMVRLCDSKKLSKNWYDKDIQHVVTYLNKNFYKFK